MAELNGNLLVAQSGGPTCAINASIAGVITEAGKKFNGTAAPAKKAAPVRRRQR